MWKEKRLEMGQRDSVFYAITLILRPVRVYLVRILWCPKKIQYRLATAGERPASFFVGVRAWL